jgi:hypothetical protein
MPSAETHGFLLAFFISAALAIFLGGIFSMGIKPLRSGKPVMASTRRQWLSLLAGCIFFFWLWYTGTKDPRLGQYLSINLGTLVLLQVSLSLLGLWQRKSTSNSLR